MCHLKRFWPAALATFAFATGAFGQRGTTPGSTARLQRYNLVVSVRQEMSELPVGGAQVEVRGMMSNQTSGTANGAGDCQFNGMLPDQYELLVTSDGYEPAATTAYLMSDSYVVVHMRKRPETAAGDKVSVRTLQLPDKARDAYLHGLTELYGKHHPEKSVPLFETTLKQAPDFYEAHHHMGMAFDELGRLHEAEDQFRLAIQSSEGKYSRSQFALAALLSGRKEFAPAEAAAREGLETTPDSGLGHYELARALLGQGKTDPAEAEAHTALTQAQKPAKAYLVLAAIHDQRHELEKLLEDLNEYLKMVPAGPNSERMRQRGQEVEEEIRKNATAAPAPPSPRP